MINGKTAVIWPFAGFSTRFLKMDPIQTCLYHKTRQYFSDVVSRNKKYTVD
jgi:hypothetical protein